jgi:3-oxoacyl-[acyl-carrier-protein] synthase II
VRRYDRFVHYGQVATMQAVTDAGLMAMAATSNGSACASARDRGLPMIEDTHNAYLQGGLRKISPFLCRDRSST